MMKVVTLALLIILAVGGNCQDNGVCVSATDPLAAPITQMLFPCAPYFPANFFIPPASSFPPFNDSLMLVYGVCFSTRIMFIMLITNINRGFV